MLLGSKPTAPGKAIKPQLLYHILSWQDSQYDPHQHWGRLDSHREDGDTQGRFRMVMPMGRMDEDTPEDTRELSSLQAAPKARCGHSL